MNDYKCPECGRIINVSDKVCHRKMDNNEPCGACIKSRKAKEQMKAFWKSKESKSRLKNLQQGRDNYFRNASQEQLASRSQKISTALTGKPSAYWASLSDEEKADKTKAFLENVEKWRSGLTEAERVDHNRLLSEIQKRKWDGLSNAQKSFIISQLHKNHDIWYNSLSVSDRESYHRSRRRHTNTEFNTLDNEAIFYLCRRMPFPYPKYTDMELIKSYTALVAMVCTGDVSLNSRIGDRVITHFHPSIYRAHNKGNMSPYEAWYDDNLLRKCIRNRLIYQTHLNPNKILQGFNVSKIAPKVSVFSAARAKIIIAKYLSKYNEIFDPFAGFGGRLLGAVSLGKTYVGQDISDGHIKESIKMCEFLNIQDCVSLSEADARYSSGKYECLFTCPPYSDKEQWSMELVNLSCDEWIDICIHNFKCHTYVFVVDKTVKYQPYVTDVISNKSHFGKSAEMVLVINKEE